MDKKISDERQTAVATFVGGGDGKKMFSTGWHVQIEEGEASDDGKLRGGDASDGFSIAGEGTGMAWRLRDL